MFIFDSVWARIRDQFTQEEIAAINKVVVGRVICPSGGVISEGDLDPAILNKLRSLIDASPLVEQHHA